MNKVEYSDLYRFHFLSDVVYAPDGAHAVFSVHQADEEKNGYKSELWLLNCADDSVRRLTAGGDEKGAFWLDESTVVFSTAREKKPEQKGSRWYRICIDGGEAEFFLETEEKVSSIKPIGSNKYLVLSSQPMNGKTEEKPNEANQGKDFYIFDEIPFWFDGKGIKNGQRDVLSILDAKENTLTPLTPPDMAVEGLRVSKDKRYAVYSATAFKNVKPRCSGLYLYDIASGETRTLVPQDKMSIGSLCFMNGDRLFFTGTTYKFPGCNPQFYIMELVNNEIRELPFCDFAPGNTVGTDCSYGGGNNMVYKDGWLYFLKTVYGNSKLVRMDAEGTLETVCDTPGAITCFDLFGDRLLMIAMRGVEVGEMWSLNLTTGNEKRITCFNKAYMESHSVVTPEYFTFNNSDNVELEGFVLKPVGYESGKKYPAILEMHGGPKVVFGGIFHHEMQCLANQGYFVFYTNPRGADGRGENFANITGQLGYIDFQDFMEFTDEVLKRYPDIDADRVGICGGSYGGFMCNWMIGHTDRFAAAASQRSISNYLTKSLCTDIGYNHNMSQLETDPWQDFDRVWEHSPLKCAPNAKTPTLFIQSDEDYRCWMSDAIQMYTALKMNGTDARLALFHGESHGLSRIGKPQNRISRLIEIGNWFKKYLKG